MTTDADGWIEHDGKGMPVDGETEIEVMYADGIKFDGRADEWTGWDWEGHLMTRIVRYRIADAMMTERAK